MLMQQEAIPCLSLKALVTPTAKQFFWKQNSAISDHVNNTGKEESEELDMQGRRLPY